MCLVPVRCFKSKNSTKETALPAEKTQEQLIKTKALSYNPWLVSAVILSGVPSLARGILFVERKRLGSLKEHRTSADHGATLSA